MAQMSALQDRLHKIDMEKQQALRDKRRSSNMRHANYLKDTGATVEVSGLKKGLSYVQIKLIKRFLIFAIPGLLFLGFRLAGPMIVEIFPEAESVVTAVESAPTSMTELEDYMMNIMRDI
jgi:hypothetical protein